MAVGVRPAVHKLVRRDGLQVMRPAGRGRGRGEVGGAARDGEPRLRRCVSRRGGEHGDSIVQRHGARVT